jgi:hypothetical protein
VCWCCMGKRIKDLETVMVEFQQIVEELTHMKREEADSAMDELQQYY